MFVGEWRRSHLIWQASRFDSRMSCRRFLDIIFHTGQMENDQRVHRSFPARVVDFFRPCVAVLMARPKALPGYGRDEQRVLR
jgi:hypothetical protein